MESNKRLFNIMKIVFYDEIDKDIQSLTEDDVETGGKGYELRYILPVPEVTVDQFVSNVIDIYPDTDQAIQIAQSGKNRLSQLLNLGRYELWKDGDDWKQLVETGRHKYEMSTITMQEESDIGNVLVSNQVRIGIIQNRVLNTITHNSENQNIVNVVN